MKILIIGGGFAGINLAKELENHKEIEVVLIDKNNYNFSHHLFIRSLLLTWNHQALAILLENFLLAKKTFSFAWANYKK